MSEDPNKKYMPRVRAVKRFLIAKETESHIGMCEGQPTVHMDVTYFGTPKDDEVHDPDTLPTSPPHNIRFRVKGGDEGSDEPDIWFSLDGGLERLKEIVQQIESLQESLKP